MKRCKNCGREITEDYGDRERVRCVWCRNGHDLTEASPCDHPIQTQDRQGRMKCTVCGVRP